jgi:hypothetical protein
MQYYSEENAHQGENTHLMSHKRQDSPNSLIRPMPTRPPHHLPRKPQRLLVMRQCDCIVLRREVTVYLLEDEVLRVG